MDDRPELLRSAYIVVLPTNNKKSLTNNNNNMKMNCKNQKKKSNQIDTNQEKPIIRAKKNIMPLYLEEDRSSYY